MRKKNSAKLQLKPIEEIARSIGIKKKHLELYGPYKAKISLDLLRSVRNKKQGKYIVITSITPTPLGEGKTTTAIGLSMAFHRLRKKSVASIPQPSLGAVFGIKGPGTGGGAAQVFPREDANLHFTGDSHAVLAAHNLCAAYLDNSIFNGNHLGIAAETISWLRAVNVNDRLLRTVNIGLGGKADGVSRKSGFESVSSSELMAILAFSDSIKDMRQRLGKIVLGFTKSGKPVTAEDIKAAGSMAALLKDALKPNLIQTTEGTPCFMHTESRADVSIGSSSVIADKIALGLSDYVISEAGFGIDTGCEKFFDIKCRESGLKPNAVVIVCTLRAFKMHSGDFEVTPGKPFPREMFRENVSLVERGLSNLEKQIENINIFGVPIILCLNRFPEDTEKEIDSVRQRGKALGAADIVISDAYKTGGEGAAALAQSVAEACKIKHAFRFLYPVDLPVKEKIKRIAKTIYGAKEVEFSEEVDKKTLLYKKQKLDNLPVCIAKTHLSLSHNPKRKGRPHGFKFPVRDLKILNGAGYITALADDTKILPGLPKTPRGAKIDIDEEGKIIGLF